MKPDALAENVQTIFEISSGKLILKKSIFTMKNLADFRKTVETGMDPRLNFYCREWWFPLGVTDIIVCDIETDGIG